MNLNMSPTDPYVGFVGLGYYLTGDLVTGAGQTGRSDINYAVATQ